MEWASVFKIFIDKTFLLMIWSHNSMAWFLDFPIISRVQDEFTKKKMARHTHVYTHTAHSTHSFKTDKMKDPVPIY